MHSAISIKLPAPLTHAAFVGTKSATPPASPAPPCPRTATSPSAARLASVAASTDRTRDAARDPRGEAEAAEVGLERVRVAERAARAEARRAWVWWERRVCVKGEGEVCESGRGGSGESV